MVAAGRVAQISGELSKFSMCFAFRAHFAPQKIHPLKSMRYRTKFPIGNFFVSKNMAFPPSVALGQTPLRLGGDARVGVDVEADGVAHAPPSASTFRVTFHSVDASFPLPPLSSDYCLSSAAPVQPSIACDAKTCRRGRPPSCSAMSRAPASLAST